jgi:adenylylsulfate kinase
MTHQENIFPVFDQLLQQTDKETLLKQKAKVIWMTGLSGSGKTTLATGLESILHQKGFLTQVLDGDNIRTGINNNLGFSKEDREENIRRIAEVSKLLVSCGIITINCFVSPLNSNRETAREIIGNESFVEIYINASLEECEKRDTKGLYKKARRGEIKDFTGINAPFEPPLNPFLEVRTDQLSIEESLQIILDCILPVIKVNS